MACAHDLLSFYTEIQSRDADAIRARGADPKSRLDESLRDLLEAPSYLPIKWSYTERYSMTDDNVDLYAGLSVLANHVSTLVSDVRLRLSSEDVTSVIFGEEEHYFFGTPLGGVPPTVRQTWHCPTLTSAIYMQFCLMLTDSRPVRYCENPACGMPFPATRKDKRFCNDTCRSNARYYR